MSRYFDLGTYRRKVTTRSAKASRWFNRGLAWAYGFNHEESNGCFSRAIESDPDCVMAYWGLAYALGPNYNAQWDAFDPKTLAKAVGRAHAALAAAAERSSRAQPVERALIRALSARFPAAVPLPDCGPWNAAYAEAMREVYRAHPGDLDVAALFADALMNLAPWALWDQRTGEPSAASCTGEARAVLERALATDAGREHPGVLHFYIHLMEMSPFPELALPAGDLLRDLVPDAGHLLHMPTHLDLLCGDYPRVVSSNASAIAADERYLAAAGAMNVYTLYRVHDYHFKIYGAMFLGQSRVALQTADQLAAAIPEALLRVDQPARHAYGALLLEQGRVAEAEAVYRADLGLDRTLARACQHPGNLWSLHGYHECLVRLGKHELADVVADQLKIASAYADVPVTSSCYCRLSCHA